MYLPTILLIYKTNCKFFLRLRPFMFLIIIYIYRIYPLSPVSFMEAPQKPL
ncbi:unnamed protein product [Arabidopsis halleri]